MTFLVDINAMLFSSPRTLFPALARDQFGGGARAAGLLYAAPAVGAVAAAAGGAVARVRRQGLGVVIAIAAWGVAIAGFGMSRALWAGLLMLALAGAADTVNAVYRSTILQVATPAGMQGRLQGVYFVVVTGAPRLGDIRAGGMAEAVGAQMSVVSGGLACIAGIALLAVAVPSFIRYDARETTATAAPAD